MRVSWDLEAWGPDAVFLEGGYLLPRRFHGHVELEGGTAVDVDIAIEGDRARARTVAVSTDRPGGVGWTTLSKVPTRDIVATAALGALRRVDVEADETMSIGSLGAGDAERAREIVQELVGYKPDLDLFEHSVEEGRRRS